MSGLKKKKKTDEQTEIKEQSAEFEALDERQTEEPDKKDSSVEQDCEKELAECRERMLRLQADFDNFRKRSIKERSELIKSATRDFIEELLPVLDHFELGLRAAEETDIPHSVTTGFKLVYDQLFDHLKGAGVMPIEAEGKPFDPNLHDCISCIPSETHPENMIITQTRAGYRINDQLLRPAQVVVSGGPAEYPHATNTEESGDVPSVQDGIVTDKKRLSPLG